MAETYRLAKVKAFVEDIRQQQEISKQKEKTFLKMREIRLAKMEKCYQDAFDITLQMVEKHFGPEALEKVKREGE
jgi:hypothetical protein